MLRSSTSARRPASFTCALCALRPVRRLPTAAAVRTLHSSDKSADQGYGAPSPSTTSTTTAGPQRQDPFFSPGTTSTRGPSSIPPSPAARPPDPFRQAAYAPSSFPPQQRRDGYAPPTAARDAYVPSRDAYVPPPPRGRDAGTGFPRNDIRGHNPYVPGRDTSNNSNSNYNYNNYNNSSNTNNQAFTPASNRGSGEYVPGRDNNSNNNNYSQGSTPPRPNAQTQSAGFQSLGFGPGFRRGAASAGDRNQADVAGAASKWGLAQNKPFDLSALARGPLGSAAGQSFWKKETPSEPAAGQPSSFWRKEGQGTPAAAGAAVRPQSAQAQAQAPYPAAVRPQSAQAQAQAPYPATMRPQSAQAQAQAPYPAAARPQSAQAPYPAAARPQSAQAQAQAPYLAAAHPQSAQAQAQAPYPAATRPQSMQAQAPDPARDPRDLARDPRAFARDPRGFSRDPGGFARDPRELSRDPRSFSRDPRAFANDPREFAREPARDMRDLASDPRALARDPRGFARDPRNYARDPARASTVIPRRVQSNALDTQERGDVYTPVERIGAYTQPERTDAYMRPERRDAYARTERTDTYTRPERSDAYVPNGRREQYARRESLARDQRTDTYIPRRTERADIYVPGQSQQDRDTDGDGDSKRGLTPSRFSVDEEAVPSATRSREVDEDYERRQEERQRDKRKNRQFDDEESAILDDEPVLTAKQQRKLKKAKNKRKEKPAEPIPLLLPQFISVENLATVLNVPMNKFEEQLKELGFTETSHDHVLNSETAGLIAMEYGYDPVVDKGDALDLKPRPVPEDKSHLPTRPPVVTIMGHVDHGKTTLLDWLRKSSVVASEHGGITQHIGAFSVTMPSGKVITFLDTPGHAAFLSMRSRGATVTDIVILVVAADDSVKPQTIEAIKHAKSAGVPLIVAINKIDKPSTNVERVKLDLARHGVEVEDFGGDTQVVCVSGKTGEGMQQLEEATITLSEILDHRADPEGLPEGWVLEATTKKRGRVATVLVTAGTIRPGDIIVAGRTWAKVRTLTNEHGVELPAATPGTPVEIDGWKDQPDAGDQVLGAPSEDRAKTAVSYRAEKAERIQQAIDMEAINASRRQQHERDESEDAIRTAAVRAGENPDTAVAAAQRAANTGRAPGVVAVPFIVKADVFGSVEAVVHAVQELGNAEVHANVLRSSFGGISEFDIDHAAAAGAYVLAFNLPPDPNMLQYARAKKVSIIQDNVIYRLVDAVKEVLSDKLPPLVSHRVLGEAEVLQVFEINIKRKKFKPVAGCRVRNGVIKKSAKVRVVRRGKPVWEGSLESLKNKQESVNEMKRDTECGMGFEGWRDFQVGDTVQCFEVVEQKRTL